MIHQVVLSHYAHCRRRSHDDRQLGMLLDALQLSSEITQSPERFFGEALALVERAEGGSRTRLVLR